MQINTISNTSFSAKIDGDLKEIKNMALRNGLPEHLYKRTISKMHEHFPDNKTTIRLYNRFIKKSDCCSTVDILLQKVKVIKNHEVLDEMLVKATGKYGVVSYLSAVKKLAQRLCK